VDVRKEYDLIKLMDKRKLRVHKHMLFQK